ncbi:MAG: hypothetical protein M1813_009146 [Trichoglossum hirsutum]|nr:MAG: hypothetical protein M1813_009146 [Trichoglossum hirsutum]
MALCDLCQGIRVDTLVPYCPPGQEDEAFKVGYEHQPNYRALEVSSQNCPLCKLLLHALEEGGAAADRMPEEIRDKEESRIWLIGGQEMFFDLSRPMNLSQINVQAGNAWRHTVLGLYTDEDDPAATSGDIVGREISIDPSSDRSFTLASRWIRDCVAQHNECSLAINPGVSMEIHSEIRPLPTRLINVGEPDEKPFLCHTGGSVGQYVSLSYCWGSAVALTTKKETYNARCEGIEFSTIPKTIRDAIIITRKLGLRYLWVDALCIIQDDDEDWQREAAQMGLVYRNALFTISATGASDTSVGCFTRHTPMLMQPVKLDYRSHDGKRKGRMFMRSQPATVADSLDRSPVNSRGWCLQERILSRRVLHYTKDQMYWECQKHCAAEDGTVYDYFFRLKQSFDLRDHSGLDINPSSVFWRWCQVAVEYSNRKLTKQSDKLPAMSGLASEVARRTGDQYLAGLWRSHLHVGLLWESTPGKMVRPSAFRAPSWSWASLDGPLRYAGMNSLITTSAPSIDILDANVTKTGGDVHGGVSAGYIRLSGQLKHATRSDGRVHRLTDGWGSSVPWGYDVIDSASMNIGYAIFDEVDSIVPKDLLCLRISDNPRQGGVAYNILVLEATGSEHHEYRRLGMGKISQTGWFDDCPKAAIVII